MVLKNKILWGVLGVVVIVCVLQEKAFSLTHPLSGILINNASESSLISQTNQAYAASLQQNTQQQQTFSSFNKTTNAEANQLIALSSKKNIHQKTFSDSDLPVSNKFTSLNTISTSAAATITSSASSGNWSDPTSWSGGVVPGANDDVVIAAGTTILVDANTTCQSITIESGGILQVANSITLTLTGDWTNSGTFDAGTSGIVEFTGSTSSTISGTTAFEELIISKDNLSIPITITGNVTVSSGGNLTLTGGLIQVNSGASLNLDYSNQLTIPAAAGFEVNGGTLETGNFSITNEGLIRVNSGTANFGTASGNSVHTQVDGAFHVIDGTVNIAGRLENTAGGTLPPDIPSGINISGGTVNLATEGNGLSNTGSLQVSTQGAFNFTGGTIVFQNASTASTAIDMGLSDGTGNGSKTITNGIFQFGNGSTTSLSEFVIDSEIPIPNIEVYDNMDLALASPLTISDELVLGTNTQISLNTNSLKMKIVPAFGSINIPLSDDSGNAMPLSVEITSGSYASDASITVSSIEGKPGSNANTSNYLNRYWTLDINGVGVDNDPLEYNVLADYPQSDVIGTESAITMGVHTGSLPWIKGAINTSTNEISATGLNASSILFSGITAAPPTIVIDNSESTAICEGSSVNLTTTATGDPIQNYAWTSTPAGFTASTADISVTPNTTTNYEVTVTDGNGFTASDAIDVVINPTPSVDQPANQIVCNSDATAAVNFSGTASSYNWTNDNTTIGLAASGNGNIASFTATNTTNAPIVANIEVTPVYSNAGVNCSGTPKSLTITVNPTPSVDQPANQIVCNSDATAAVNFSGTASSYNWTNDNTTIGLAASGNGNIASFTATNTTNAPIVANIEVTPVYSNAGVNCSGTPKSLTITVNPTPSVDQPANQIVCNSDATAAVNFSGTASSYNWTNDNTTIGLAASGNGNIASFTATNTTNAPIVANIEVTPVYSNAGVNCSGTPKSLTITVNPTPSVDQPANQIVCNSDATAAVNFSGTASSYNWTNDNTTIGLAASGNGNIASFTATNTTNAPIVANIEVTPVYSNAGVNCSGTPKSLTITVNPTPSVANPGDLSYCMGEVTPEITLTGSPSNVLFNITGGNTIGLTDRTGVTEIPSFTALPGNATITIIPVANGCSGSPINFTIDVTPLPNIQIPISSQTICSGESTLINLTSNAPSASFSWTVIDSGTISGATNGTGNTITQALVNSGPTISAVTYEITVEANGCPGAKQNFEVTVYPEVTANITGNTSLCEGAPEPSITFTANGGTPPYTFTYTINGGANKQLTTSTGNSASLNVPSHTSGTYTYQLTNVKDNAICEFPQNSSATINIISSPVLTSTLSPPGICSNDEFSYTPESDVPGTTFSWHRPAVTGISNPAGSGTDNPEEYLENTTDSPIAVSYTYTLTTPEGCINTQEITVMVTPVPHLTSTTSGLTVCSGAAFSYTPTSDVGGTNFPWTRAAVSGISNPAASGAGNPSETLINTSGSPVGVTYVYTLESNNCENPVTYSVPVVVMPAPNVTASASEYTICPGESIDLFSSSDIGGGTMPTTLLSESFNSASSGSTSGPNGWTTDYNDNNARWTVRNNNYYYNTPGPGGVTFSSNDNSRFYLANLNDGSGWGINSRLISPSINTTGYTDLELRLWHYYRSGGNSDHAQIQISTDGSSWNTIEEFYSTQGSSTNFTQYTYDLSGYVGQPSLYIRFRYRGRDRDYFWAIDNISITGTPASVADVQWTSNTSSWTSTEINPTNISPTETTSYTVTYTDPDTGCDGSATTTIVVRDLPDISVDADYCSTPGDIILTASGASNYLWSTGETSNSIVVDVAGNFFVTGTDSYGCSATASYNTANELVVNGNFEAGNTGFTSGYGFRNPWITPPNYATNSSNSALWDENYYGIGENGRYYHSNFWGRDHSSGTGNYMIVNGNTSAGTPIWEQQVVVQPNTDYYFSAWAISLNRAGNYAVLQFEVDGVLVGTQARLPAGDNNDSNNNWVRFYSDPKWNSGSTSGLITIRIRNVEPAAGGNDFGLDDISFGTLDPSPAQIAPSANTSELCSGEALELYANTTGGKSPISFSWVGPNGFSSVEENPVISEADETYSGTYTLTVTDGYGCAISPESISVTIFPPPTVDAGADQEICSATPVISLSGSVGGAATSGIWNGMGGGSFDDNTQLSTLYTPSQAEISAGQAILVLKTEDPSGPCLPITDTVIVTINPSPELTIDLTHPSCNGESTGSASVSVSSGEPPFSFLWSDGQTTSSATNLAAGSYSITITDNNGCSSNTSIEIIDPPLLVIDLPSFTSPSCYGGNDGTATIHVNGGSPPYSYLWDANAGNQTSQTATGLTAGIYMYTVTDANGCNLTTDFVQVIDSPPPVFDCSSLSNIVTNADNGETFASNVSTLYPASIDLSCQALSWDMHYKGSIINSGDHSDFPNQYTFQVDTTTINFVATNFAGEQLTCSYDVIVIPNDPPEIACSSPAPISVTPNNCSATLSISLPTVISGTAISWSWIMEGATTDSGTGSIPSPYTFYTGETTIRWTATNNAGSDECTQVITVTDTEPPIITPPDPYEDCVESLFLAQYNGTTNLTYNPMYPDADYHLFEAGNTSLDLDMPNDYDDNCCTAADSYTINWRIDFDGSEPSISGIGQPSEYGSDMPLWGDGVTYQNRVHTISYWVVDCHGNTSLEYSTTITIAPRPNLIKVNE